MQKEWLSQVIRFNLSGATYRYAIALRLLSVDDVVSVSGKKISYLLGTREEQISRSKKELEKLGLLESITDSSGNPAIQLLIPSFGTDDEIDIYNLYINNINNYINISKTDRGDARGEREKPKKPVQQRNLSAVRKELPDVIDPKVWDEFVAMRQRIRKPLTPYAAELTVKDLLKYQGQGHNPNEILHQSIKNSWQGVFPPKDFPARHGGSEGKQSINDLVAKLEGL